MEDLQKDDLVARFMEQAAREERELRKRINEAADKLEASQPRNSLYRVRLTPQELAAILRALKECGAEAEKIAGAIEKTTPVEGDEAEREFHRLMIGRPALKVVVYALRIMEEVASAA